MNDERRSETRIVEKITVFVEARSASFDNSSPATIIGCNSLDMSATGIQIQMEQAVEIGTILRICAEFGETRKPLHLVGETKWVRSQDNHYNVGFELYDAENTDIDSWQKIVASMLRL